MTSPGWPPPPLWRFAPHDGGGWIGGQGESVGAAKEAAQAHLEAVLLGMVELRD